MTKKYLVLVTVCLIIILACSKKHQPQTAGTDKSGAVDKKGAVKAASRPLPKTLDVPDKVAMRDIDGRLYYDIEGHRYWKNYVDGKYYLFNKEMYNDPAFKPH
jgi:hypothetical protein